MPYTATTATNKLLGLKKRIRGVAGGTSASKTVSIILWLIDYIQSYKGKRVISIVSETLPHLKKGAMRDFLSIMKEHGYYDEKRWNKTDSVYDFSDDSGNKILEFFSADQSHKVRGPRRDVLFINEANNISYETFTQLEIRTNDIIWLDWNPVSEFWFYVGENGEKAVKDRDDTDFVILTYKDNEALTESIVKTIESRRGNKNWWKVYGEGQLGEAEGRIYTGWQILKAVPHEARLERRGLDFGYTNDPSVIIAVYYYNGGYILDEELYRKGLSNKQIADVINNTQTPGTLVIADSAEPKSIDEIRLYGVNILPATKGRDSINQGIQFVQDQQISITERSTNTLKEYRNYLWDVDKEGKTLNKPIGFFNHSMDAIRYAFDSLNVVTSDEPLPDDTGRFRGGWY